MPCLGQRGLAATLSTTMMRGHLYALIMILKNLLHRCVERIEEAVARGADLPTIVITVCCAWGKHRSRYVVETVR